MLIPISSMKTWFTNNAYKYAQPYFALSNSETFRLRCLMRNPNKCGAQTINWKISV